MNPADPTQLPGGLNRVRPDRLEVCRDFIRGNCDRGSELCKYAHPPVSFLSTRQFNYNTKNISKKSSFNSFQVESLTNDPTMIDTTDNTVIVCMDAVKGRCSRQTCKYFHPPPHLIVSFAFAHCSDY